jgi:hypothetical protein
MTILRGAAFVASLVLVGPRPARADEALIKGLRGEVQEMWDDGERADYRVPFSPLPGAADLRAYTTRVTLGQRDDRALIRAFSAEIVQKEIVIHVDDGKVAHPGVYRVEIEIAGRPPGGGAEVTQLVKVELTRPEGQLRQPPPLIIERTIALVGADSIVPGRLALVETSERSRLRDLRLEQLDSAAADDGPNLGKLGFGGPHRVPAGGMIDASIAVSQPFPPGTSRGTIRATSPEMKELTFTYEIRSRRPRWLVLPIFLFGSVIGWFHRVILKRREENFALRVSAEELGQELDEEIKTDPEPDVLLSDARRDLDDAVAAESSQALARAVEAAESALKSTRARREQARQTMLGRVRDQVKALGAPWVLPPSISIAEVTPLFEGARQKIIDDDLAAAQKLEREAAPALQRVAGEAMRWAEDVLLLLQQLSGELPAPLADDAKASAQAIHWAGVASAALTADDPTSVPVPAETEELLRALHDANRDVMRLVKRARAHLGEADAPDRADVKEDLRALIDAFHALDAAKKGAVTVQMESVNVSEDAPPKPAAARPTFAPRPKGPSLPRMEAGLGGGAPISSAPPPEVTKPASARKLLENTRGLMTAISALIMSVSALALYGDNFFGTQKEILALLAVAFTSDFTVVAALEAVTKIKKT